MVYGVVVQMHGCVYVDTPNYHLVTIGPSKDLATYALRSDRYLLGMSYINGRSTWITIRFNVSGRYALVYYAVSTIGNPVRMAIYASKDGKKWKLVRIDIAEGMRTVPLPYGTRYLKLVCVGGKSLGTAASLFKYLYLKREITIFDKIDLNEMRMLVNGSWIPIPYVVIMFMASYIGASVFDESKMKILISTIATALPLYLSLQYSLNPYPLGGVWGVTLGSFIYGLLLSSASKAIVKHTKNTKE